VIVYLDAIAHNVEVLQRYAGDAMVMAVVKGDAYGHGLVPSARAALRGGAHWLGVAQLQEALALRSAVSHPWRWVAANTAAWPLAMVVIFVGASTAGSA